MRKVLGLAFWGLGVAICLLFVGFVIAVRIAAPVIESQQAEILGLEEANFNLQNRYYELERAYKEIIGLFGKQ